MQTLKEFFEVVRASAVNAEASAGNAAASAAATVWLLFFSLLFLLFDFDVSSPSVDRRFLSDALS